MSKVFKDEKIFNKYKQEFKFIFKDKNFIEFTQNHFNKNGSFAAFTLAFLQNRVGEKRIYDCARINKDEWVGLFENLYKDQTIFDAYNKLSLNPIIALDKIKITFKCFDNFIDKLFDYIKEQEWSLNISNKDAKELLVSAYGYILYNSIECKLGRQLEDIVVDKDYDNKYIIILNNTKLFSEIKNNIRECCSEKINDLIVVLLGGSNHLALDK